MLTVQGSAKVTHGITTSESDINLDLVPFCFGMPPFWPYSLDRFTSPKAVIFVSFFGGKTYQRRTAANFPHLSGTADM